MSILLWVSGGADEHRAWQSALAAALPRETFVTRRDAAHDGDVDIAIVANPPPGLLAGLPKLRLIQSLWAGVEGLLADRSVPADVPLARMVDPVMTAAMEQTALWATLFLHRGFHLYAERQRRSEWRQHQQRRADEVVVAVLGLGAMGAAVAARLVANGYPVHGWSSRQPSTTVDGVACVHGDAALDGLLGASEVVLNLLPLTPATHRLFDATRFARMRRGASFVNLGRGSHVVEADLLAALEHGPLAHAVLDVYDEEPLPVAHPFWRHPRITLLPHAAAHSDARSGAAIAARNVCALREGRTLEFVVDRQRGY